jgi:hypothetical protein
MTGTLFNDAFSSTLRSCSSSADKGVELQPGRFGVQIPVDEKIFSSPKHSDWLLGLSCRPVQWVQGFLTGCKVGMWLQDVTKNDFSFYFLSLAR